MKSYSYTTVPNQKVINRVPEGHEICNREHIYFKLQKESMFKAMQELTPAVFQVWLYLASQAENYTFAFSPEVVSKETGLKKTGLQRGIRELIEDKYLVQRNDGSNIYDFYEIPKVESDEILMIYRTPTEKEYNKSEDSNKFIF